MILKHTAHGGFGPFSTLRQDVSHVSVVRDKDPAAETHFNCGVGGKHQLLSEQLRSIEFIHSFPFYISYNTANMLYQTTFPETKFVFKS